MNLHWHIQVQHVKDGEITERRPWRQIYVSLSGAETQAMMFAGRFGKHGTRRYEVQECHRDPCSRDQMAEKQ